MDGNRTEVPQSCENFLSLLSTTLKDEDITREPDEPKVLD